MEINDENLKIKIFLKKKGNLLANVNISINTIEYGFLTIKGFQIWRSSKFNERLQEEINITPPRKKIYGNFVDLVYIEDEIKWRNLEARIYNAYNKSRLNNQKKLEENVNPDDVPI